MSLYFLAVPVVMSLQQMSMRPMDLDALLVVLDHFTAFVVLLAAYMYLPESHAIKINNLHTFKTKGHIIIILKSSPFYYFFQAPIIQHLTTTRSTKTKGRGAWAIFPGAQPTEQPRRVPKVADRGMTFS